MKLIEAVFKVLVALGQPPSGGCVLKPHDIRRALMGVQPAAFRRLCVETKFKEYIINLNLTSRLQAAVC